MPIEKKGKMNRRRFLQLSSIATATASLMGPSKVLHGLETSKKVKDTVNQTVFEKKYSLCDMCFNKCGIVAKLENGIVKKLDPNPNFLKSRGMLCARGNAGLQRIYDPDRLKYPLLRKGARGEGKWQRLTWEQALDLTAENLEKIGEKYTRCGTLFMAGTDLQSKFIHRFADTYGSYNVISHESNCLVSRNRAFLDTFGEMPFPDVLNSKYIIMAGANRFEALVTPDSIDLMTAIRKDCKLVVLDPRFTKTAALAQEWHPIKPGTDMAFFLAIAHVLIDEDLYDKDFVRNKTFGFKELSDHVKKYDPNWAARECEISAADIARIARELAKAAPAAIVYPGRRTSDYTDSTQIRRAMAIVNALLGNWDKPGGLTVAQKVKLGGIPSDPPFYEDNPDERIEVGRSCMMFEEEGSFKHARDAVIESKPYPVKGFFTYKTNPMQTGANRQKTVKMIKNLDFMVTIDITMSDTAWMADVVLPSPSYLERLDPATTLQGISSGTCIATRDPVIEPLFETKSALWIVSELAKRLGFADNFNFTMEQYREKQLEKLPEVRKAIREKGVYNLTSSPYGAYEGKKFKTLSSKIELYAKRYANIKIDALPVYKRPQKRPRGQFRLVVGRNAYNTQGSTTNNALLRQLVPENKLWLHPDPAKRLGIKPDDQVWVTSLVGKEKIKVRITKETREDTVYMDTGFGVLSQGLSGIYGKGACIAEILEDKNDAISGNMAMHETFVKIRKI